MMASGGLAAVGVTLTAIAVKMWIPAAQTTAVSELQASLAAASAALKEFDTGAAATIEAVEITSTTTYSTQPGFFANLIPAVKGSAFAAAAFAVTMIAIGILIIAACVYLIVHLTGESDDAEWEVIPRKIMNDIAPSSLGEKHQYLYYDGVREAAPDDSGEETGTGQLMDVGNWEATGEHRQWLALYTTKDYRAGKPILTKGFTVSDEPTDGFQQVKKFNEPKAYNLNTYADNDGAKVYLNYKADNNYSFSVAGSVFNNGLPFAFAGGGLVVGLLCGIMIGVKARKKRVKNA